MSSFVAAEPVRLNNDAESSINFDHAGYNDDGAELVGQARQILDRAHNNEGLNTEYGDYMIELAENFLSREPRRRLRFGNDESGAKNVTPTFSQGLDEGHRNKLGDGFFEESYQGADDGYSYRWRDGEFYGDFVEDEESIFTMNVDDTEELNNKSNQLARVFSLADFRWLCLGGAIPLTMLCGMSNGMSYCGPTGMLIGFAIVTPGVLVVLACISEMIAFYPMDGGFTLLVCEYIEAPLGLAIGLLYWLNCALTVPIELLQAIKLLIVFPYLDLKDNNNLVFLTFFLVLLLVLSSLRTRNQNNAIKAASMLTISGVIALCLIIWSVCIPAEARQGSPLKLWRDSDGFRPVNTKFGKDLTRLRQVLHACSLTMRSYSGIDVPFTAMPEIRNARRTIKSGYHWISVRILIMYPALIISFTFITDPDMWNVIFDSELPTYYVCGVKPEWVAELMRDGIFCSFLTSFSNIDQCKLFYLVNAFIVFCGVFDAGIQLYGATRTLHGLGYSGVLFKQLSWCTREHVPIVSVVISISIAFVAYASVGAKIDVVFTYLQLFVTHNYLVVWASVCWAFYRFYYALKLQEKRTHVSRNSEDYPFKSWFQPWASVLGIIWCIVMFVVTTAEQYYYNKTMKSTMWRGNFVAALLPLVFLLVIYLGYKFHTGSHLVKLNQIGIMAAKRKMDAEEWEEDRVYSDGIKERVVRIFA